MNKIEVSVLNEGSINPAGTMMFLAKLTQRGHQISSMEDLLTMYNEAIHKFDYDQELITRIAKLPHGTIKRFSPITVAITGASRRFLSQIRTHQVGVDFVSASLQYSNYSGNADFVVPYELLTDDKTDARNTYLTSCGESYAMYEHLIGTGIDNDTAAYLMPQGLRNVLILQANHEAWITLINRRTCRRNTPETRYILLKVWHELLKTLDGKEMFAFAGPDCVNGICREGKMSCGKVLAPSRVSSIAAEIIEEDFPGLEVPIW